MNRQIDFEHCFITGGAGFIGSNLADRLLADGKKVTIYDNFSSGQKEFLKNATLNPNFKLIEGDLLDQQSLSNAMRGFDFVFHFAANADIRFGLDHPSKDIQQNTLATFNVLEAMRENGIKKIVFPSTGPVYGEPSVIPTPENAPFPIQTSLYGASKLACEGLIEAYCEGFGFQGWIFRFVSILGERYTHGHVFDFYKKLVKDPSRLNILGNGHQKKSYLHVQDCIDAIFIAIKKSNHKINIFNLGTQEYIEVNDSVRYICEHLGLKPQLIYAGGERGWVGDNPFIFLDCAKMMSLGWTPKISIKQGIIKTLDYLKLNQQLLDRP